MKDFFISYTKADKQWAEWIAWHLEEAGYSVVVQAWDFHPGSNFVSEMHQGLQETNRMIAVLSPDYLAAPFPESEWATTFAQDPVGSKRRLIPVRVRECKPAGLLAQLIYVDLVSLDPNAARSALLDGVRECRKPTSPPPHPGVSLPADPLPLPVLAQATPASTPTIHPYELLTILDEGLDKGDAEDFVFYLSQRWPDLQWDNLTGRTKRDRLRNLIQRLDRRKHYNALVAVSADYRGDLRDSLEGRSRAAGSNPP